MKKHIFKKGDLFEYNGDMLMVESVNDSDIEYVGVEFDLFGNAKPYPAITGFLTNQELKHVEFC